MPTYKELVNNNITGIYTLLLDTLKDDNLKLTNSQVTAQRLDSRFAFENNLKECLFDDLTKATDVLIAKYYGKWIKLIDGFLNGNLKDGATQTTVYNGNSNNDSTSSISAYDSDELLKDNGLTGNTKQDYTSSVYSLSGQVLIQNLYTNNLVYDTINTDIRHTLFNQIYTEENNENYTN